MAELEQQQRRRRDLHPGRIAVRAFVTRVGRARAKQERSPRGLRRRVVLSAIFRAMPRQLDRRRAAASGEEGTVEWRIRDGEGGVDIWTLTVADGRAKTRRGGADRPRTRIEMHTGDFFAAATGNADALELWTQGRIQIDGDIWFAGTLADMFRVPRGRRRPG